MNLIADKMEILLVRSSSVLGSSSMLTLAGDAFILIICSQFGSGVHDPFILDSRTVGNLD